MRTFDEKEIGRILQRASSLSTSKETEPGLGLSVEELHAIGRASGIDPVDIDRAIEELEGSSGDHRTSWWGGPTRYERTVVVDREMDADAWERIVSELRSTFHSPGTVTTRGSIREWTSTSGGTSTHLVSVKSADGMSRIRLFWNNEHNGLPAFVPVLVGSLIALPIVFESGQLGAAGFPIWLSVAGLLFMGCRFFLDRYVRTKKDQIDALATRMEREIRPRGVEQSEVSGRQMTSREAESSISPAGLPVSDPAPGVHASASPERDGPALDPEDLEAGPEEGTSAGRRDRTRG